MKLTQQIIIHSTDEIVDYLGAKADVDRLANHLKIQSTIPNGLSMVSVGQDAPDQNYQDIPWLQLDESNNPLSWKYFNGGEWVEIQPLNAVAGAISGLQIQYGEISFNHYGAANEWVHSNTLYTVDGSPSQFKFQSPFKAGTTIFVELVPIMSGVHAVGSDDFEWARGSVDYTGFSLYTKTVTLVAAPGKDIKFSWMAIGEKA